MFAGPGTGKSTTAAGAFHLLKRAGVNCEIVHEYAKDLTWERRSKALQFQPYVMGKQAYHIYRLLGEVDAIVTDSPILLGQIYKGDGYTPGFARHLTELFNSWNTLNVFLERDPLHHPYNPSGRNQTEEEATAIDEQILDLLWFNQVTFFKVPIHDFTAREVATLVQERLS